MMKKNKNDFKLCILHRRNDLEMKVNKRKLLMAICEALVIYGLIIVGYGILVIHITCTWSGDWAVDRNLPWLTLDVFVMISFALSFFAYIAWKYLKSLDSSS